MNYQKIYNNLIEKRQIIKLSKSDPGEKHHIIPKSIQPELKDNKSNIIKLTYREHFIAHKLLIKIYSYDIKLKIKMNYALWRMIYSNKNNEKYKVNFNSKHFAIMKEQIVQNIRIHQKSIKHKQHTEETKRKISQKCRGYKLTSEQRLKLSMALRGKPSSMKGRKQSEHAKKLISQASKGNQYAVGKIAVNNGTIMKMVYPDKIPEGFKIGALPNKKKISDIGRKHMAECVKNVRYCTNGIITIRIGKDDPLPYGFKYGNCKLKQR